MFVCVDYFCLFVEVEFVWNVIVETPPCLTWFSSTLLACVALFVSDVLMLTLVLTANSDDDLELQRCHMTDLQFEVLARPS